MHDIDIVETDVFEAKELLLQYGSVSFEIDSGMAQKFKACCYRIDKLEKSLKARGVLFNIRFKALSLYVTIINAITTFRSSSIENAVDLYMICWRNLSTVDIENKGNGIHKVTFSANT